MNARSTTPTPATPPSGDSPRASADAGVYTSSVSPMTPRKLPRNTRVDPARLSLVIERRRKERMEQLALHLNVSSAAFLEAMIDHLDDELDVRGVPSWWPAPEKKDGELDMPSP